MAAVTAGRRRTSKNGYFVRLHSGVCLRLQTQDPEGNRSFCHNVGSGLGGGAEKSGEKTPVAAM